MHRDIIGKRGDKCSKCGMDLVSVQQEKSDKYQMELTTLPQTVDAGKPTQLTLAIKKRGQMVSLDAWHERKIHLMIVSEDLSWFHHIHPEEQTDGSYAISETFPKGGKYLLFADFKPSGADQTLNKQEIEVQGIPFANDKEVSNKWISKVGGYTVTLENGNDFETRGMQPLEISIGKNGKKLQENDLQQYLGSSAHIVMIGKIGNKFLHIHPSSNSRFPIYAEANIQEGGTYRMWVQFKINGQVHTADFTVGVTQVGKWDGEEKHDMHQH
jgi:hypothetical protein